MPLVLVSNPPALMELGKGGWDPFEDITYLGAPDSKGTIFEDDIPRGW